MIKLVFSLQKWWNLLRQKNPVLQSSNQVNNLKLIRQKKNGMITQTEESKVSRPGSLAIEEEVALGKKPEEIILAGMIKYKTEIRNTSTEQGRDTPVPVEQTSTAALLWWSTRLKEATWLLEI